MKTILAKRIYSHTRYNSRKRNHKLPIWNGYKQLLQWLENEPYFNTLYSNWEASNFDKQLTPSIDRINNSLGYELGNMELVTWAENDRRGSIHLAKLQNKHGRVSAYYTNGLYIDTYRSVSNAAKELNAPNLPKILTGERKSSNGYIVKLENKDLNVYDRIRKWATTRNLIQQGDPKTQMLKFLEELAELSDAILKNDTEEICNAIGDCVVVLTNIAAMYDFKIEELINEVTEEIGHRKGKMINGTFVKEKETK